MSPEELKKKVLSRASLIIKKQGHVNLKIRPLMAQALFDNVALIKSIPQKLNLQIVEQFEKIFRRLLNGDFEVGLVHSRYSEFLGLRESINKFLNRLRKGHAVRRKEWPRRLPCEKYPNILANQ